MITTPPSLPQDRTEAPASPVRASASVSQFDSLSCPGNSRPGPNSPVGSTQTFDKRSLKVAESGPDVTRSHVPQQHYQTLSFLHLPLQPPPAPTQQQLDQLRFHLVQSQQREEQLQLQLEVMRQDLWQQKFQQQQLYRQLQLQLQQQHHPEQYFASQNGPPSQGLFPVNDGSMTPTQPWASEVLC